MPTPVPHCIADKRGLNHPNVPRILLTQLSILDVTYLHHMTQSLWTAYNYGKFHIPIKIESEVEDIDNRSNQ